MKLIKKTTIFWALMAALLSSCGTKEFIEPSFEPVPLDEQLRKKPLRVSIETDPMKVEEFGTEFGEVSELGPIFQELANIAANLQLSQDGGQDYEIDPIIYFAPELDQIEDWSLIDRLGLERMALKVVDATDWQVADLGFIKDIRLYLDFTLPEEGSPEVIADRGFLIASYNKEEDPENLTDLGRKIELKVNNLDWKEILKTQRTFVIHTELVVEKVPETEMEISAEVGVFLGLEVGL